MMECSHCLMSVGVNDGIRSVFIGLAFATALAITVDNVFRSRSCVGCIHYFDRWRDVVRVICSEVIDVVLFVGCLMTHLKVVDGSVISFIDEILADESSVVNGLLLCNISFSSCSRCSSLA